MRRAQAKSAAPLETDDRPAFPTVSPGAAASDSRLRENASPEAVQQQAATGRSLTTIETLLKGVARVDARFAIVWLAEGSVAGKSVLLPSVIDAANRVHAKIYTLTETDTDAGNADAIATATGGFVTRRADGFDAAIARIGRETSALPIGITPRAPAAPPHEMPSAAAADVSSPSSPAPAIPLESGTLVTPTPPASGDTALRVRPLGQEYLTDLVAGDWFSRNAEAGWAAYQRGDVAAARTALAEVVAQKNAPSWTHYLLGQSDFALNDFTGAVGEWEKVLARQPGYEAVYFDLMDGYVKLNERNKALRVLRQAKARWPRDPDVTNAIAVTLAAGGAFDDAIKVLEEGIRVTPDDPSTIYNLAKSLELRYFKRRRYLAGPRLWVTDEPDRQNATMYYNRYIQMNGPYTDLASEGLARLRAVDNRPVK